MKRVSTCRTILEAVGLISLLAIPALVPDRAQAASDGWRCDWTIYGLAAGMSGDVTLRGVEADIDVPFDVILENLEFGAMTSLRVGKGRWAGTVDVIYMGLGTTKRSVTVEMDQWCVEPTVSYRVHPAVELLGGVRYNSLEGKISGPAGNDPGQTEDWIDPIVGAHLALPIGGPSLLAHFRGDVGGFGIGSELTWQAFPYLTWRFAGWGSAQGGYRWVDNDYESGSGSDEFVYDVMTQGPQLGLAFHF